MSLKKGSCKASSAVTRSFGSNSNMGIRKSENSFKRNGELGKSRIIITIISSVPFFVTHKIYVPVRCQGPTRTFRWELHTVAMVSASICVAALLCEQFALFDCHQIISSLINWLPSIIIYPSAFTNHKAWSIHMILKSDSSFSSFVALLHVGAWCMEQCSAMATCQARVMVLPRPMLPTDAVLLETNKQ